MKKQNSHLTANNKSKSNKAMVYSSIENPKFIIVFTLLLALIPILAILVKVFSGGVALWNDPARDLVSALDNAHKPTLIGPPAGIPGIFYGPYWIWLLSFAQLFSKQPGMIAFTALTLPYLVLFPFILSRLSSVFSKSTIALMYLIFLCAHSNYLTDLWNPNPAPLLVLLAIYILYKRGTGVSRKNILITALAGFSVGLVMNFQLSFGICLLFGSILYLIGESVLGIVMDKQKVQIIAQRLLTMVYFFIGVLISFLPFLLFELRHQFAQTKIFLTAFTHLGNGLVKDVGLPKSILLQLFFGKPAELLHLPFWIGLTLFLLVAIYYEVSLFTKSKFPIQTNTSFHQEKKLVAIILCIAGSVLSIYLTARNPVWSYHFIGVEILWLLLLGLVINRLKYVWILIACWVTISVTGVSIKSIQNNPRTIYGTAASKQATVSKVQQEANNQDYTVFAYEPGIYPYEYTYLFKTLYNKDVPYRPEENKTNSQLVFLIIPPNLQSDVRDDFIHYRTPPARYTTVSQWTQPDGTQILKRIKAIHTTGKR